MCQVPRKADLIEAKRPTMILMLSAATKAVMMLAAFAIFFALVCPVAVTPMPVQKHVSATAPIALNAAIVVAFFVTMVELLAAIAIYVPANPTDLNCVRNC